MKRVVASVVFSSLLALGMVSLVDLGGGADLAVTSVMAQARTKRAPHTKVPAKRGGAATPAQAPAACGGDGQPKCPLGQWMEDNVQPAAENGDLARLATLYTKMAGWAPNPAWNTGASSWRAIAEDGAAKAMAGDTRGARAACKQCHRAWRDRYEAEYPGRAVPTPH